MSQTQPRQNAYPYPSLIPKQVVDIDLLPRNKPNILWRWCLGHRDRSALAFIVGGQISRAGGASLLPGAHDGGKVRAPWSSLILVHPDANSLLGAFFRLVAIDRIAILQLKDNELLHDLTVANPCEVDDKVVHAPAVEDEDAVLWQMLATRIGTGFLLANEQCSFDSVFLPPSRGLSDGVYDSVGSDGEHRLDCRVISAEDCQVDLHIGPCLRRGLGSHVAILHVVCCVGFVVGGMDLLSGTTVAWVLAVTRLSGCSLAHIGRLQTQKLVQVRRWVMQVPPRAPETYRIGRRVSRSDEGLLRTLGLSELHEKEQEMMLFIV